MEIFSWLTMYYFTTLTFDDLSAKPYPSKGQQEL
jgi:hypothetical protein